MKVFITGASGFIGSAVTKELIAHGHTVVGQGRSDSSGDKIKANGAEFIKAEPAADLELVARVAAEADATIHCAFDNSFTDFAKACADDQAVINAVGAVYEGTGKTLLMCSGALIIAGIEGADEDTSVTPEHVKSIIRAGSEIAALAWAERGVNVGVMRLPPMVHHPRLMTHGFITLILSAHKKAGYAAVIEGDETTWSAANVLDVAVLFRLALEKTKGGMHWHPVADNAVKISDIAKVAATKLDIPLKTIKPEDAVAHFGFLGPFLQRGGYVTNAKTIERAGWTITQPGLLEELERGSYFDMV